MASGKGPLEQDGKANRHLRPIAMWWTIIFALWFNVNRIGTFSTAAWPSDPNRDVVRVDPVWRWRAISVITTLR